MYIHNIIIVMLMLLKSVLKLIITVIHSWNLSTFCKRGNIVIIREIAFVFIPTVRWFTIGIPQFLVVVSIIFFYLNKVMGIRIRLQPPSTIPGWAFWQCANQCTWSMTSSGMSKAVARLHVPMQPVIRLKNKTAQTQIDSNRIYWNPGSFLWWWPTVIPWFGEMH